MVGSESRLQSRTLLARTSSVKPPARTVPGRHHLCPPGARAGTVAAAVIAALAAGACATPRVTGSEPWMRSQGALVAHPSYGPTGSSEDHEAYAGRSALRVLEGRATYYSDSLAGNRTASGEVYNPQGFSAASRDLPFGTIVRVTRVDNGRSVIVRVNDRGPFRDRSRILDLSKAAARKLRMLREGVVEIRAEVLEFGKKRRKR